MKRSGRNFALLLALTPGIGGKTLSRVITRNSMKGVSNDEFLALRPEVWREEYGLSLRAAEALHRQIEQSFDSIAELQARMETLGVGLVTATDAHYPSLVSEMDPDPPGVLFTYGAIQLLERNTFAVMSSRDSSGLELNRIEELTESGVLNGEVLVCGHDRPEYQRSAVVPLRWGSPRILCLDRGLFTVLGPDLQDEAFRAARLWRYQFDPKTDMVVSAFRPEADFIGVNNQVRDRLVGCMARRIDFVRISAGGNMSKIARMALKAGRTVRVGGEEAAVRALLDMGAARL